jgi:hypothetical protein
VISGLRRNHCSGVVLASKFLEIGGSDLPAGTPGSIFIDYVEKNETIVHTRFFLGHCICSNFATTVAMAEYQVGVAPGFVPFWGECRVPLNGQAMI